MSTNKKIKFKVNGIKCNGCVNKIKESINSLSIEHTTEIDVETGFVKVEIDSNQASVSEVKAKIISAGFGVEGVELE